MFAFCHVFDPQALFKHIKDCIEAISLEFPSALIILAGDMNMLSEQELVARTALVSIVTEPTRGSNRLDRVYVSEPSYESVIVVASTGCSDHKAVIAYTGMRKSTMENETPESVQENLANKTCEAFEANREL